MDKRSYDKLDYHTFLIDILCCCLFQGILLLMRSYNYKKTIKEGKLRRGKEIKSTSVCNNI